MNKRLMNSILLFVIIFVGYILFNPYLTSALGSIAGSYTSAAAASLIGVIAVWVQGRVKGKVE